MSNLSINFPDLGISKTISGIKQWSKIGDLKEKIAALFHLDSNRIVIENEKEFQANPGSQKLNLKIIGQNKGKKINLHIPPNEKEITLANGAATKFDDIFEELKQNNFYISPSCDKKNFVITFQGKDKSIGYEEDCYPFLDCPENTEIFLNYIKDYSYIKYDHKIFFFPDNEKAKNASQFIFEILHKEAKICSIKIRKEGKSKDLKDDSKLKKSKNYTLKIECIFNLRSKLNEKANSDQTFEYTSEISEAKERLKIFYSDFNDLKIENIIIFDQQGQKITDPKTRLKDVKNSENIIFFDFEGIKKSQNFNDHLSSQKPESEKPKKRLLKKNFQPRIKSIGSTKIIQPITKSDLSQKVTEGPTIPIQFVFENTENRPFKIDVNLNTKMAELSQIISKQFNFTEKEKVQLKYQYNQKIRITIDYEMTVDDVKDDICVTDPEGDKRNVMYIYVKQKKNNKDDSAQPKKLKGSGKKKRISPVKHSLPPTSSSDNFNLSDQVSLEFLFEFGQIEKKVSLLADSCLGENEAKIKGEFGIDDDDDIEYEIVGKSGNLNENDQMKKFKGSKIKIIQKVIDDKDDQKANKFKINFQTNRSDKIYKISLDVGSTVKDFKTEIAQIYSVDNLADIKIIFSGKDLLDGIQLDKLEAGDIVLYVYIRSTEDILLMTAKALRVSQQQIDMDDIIIEEEEEEVD